MIKQTTEVRKKQIVQVALDIIGARGVSKLTTLEVAKKVGFSEAALFRHFPNKLEVIKATMIHAHDGLSQGIESITCQSLNPLEMLEEILRFQLSYINQNRGMPRIIFSDELHLGNRELRDTLFMRHQKYIGMIITVIREGIASGIFRKDLDAQMAARTFFGLIQTAVFGSSLNDFTISLEEQFVPISRFLRGCFLANNCPDKN